MHIGKVLRLLGIAIASLALVMMTVSASSNSLSSSFALEDQKFTAKITDKEEVMGVHSPKFGFEENNDDDLDGAVQRFGITHPAVADRMVENDTVTTIKLNTTQFQQFNKSEFKKAPEFAQISGYVNTPDNSPLTLSSLKGKVVLVYIWTYTCINSIRPMPYIHDWNQKYSNNGLVIVGVHAPEFQFEKNYY